MTRRDFVAFGAGMAAAAFGSSFQALAWTTDQKFEVTHTDAEWRKLLTAPAIRGVASGGHGTSVHEPVAAREASRHVCLRRLRARRVLVGDEVRQRNRVAEFLGSDRARDRHNARHLAGHGADRRALPPVWRSPRPRVRRWPEADRTAVLHQRRRVDVQADVGCGARTSTNAAQDDSHRASSDVSGAASEVTPQQRPQRRAVGVAHPRGDLVHARVCSSSAGAPRARPAGSGSTPAATCRARSASGARASACWRRPPSPRRRARSPAPAASRAQRSKRCTIGSRVHQMIGQRVRGLRRPRIDDEVLRGERRRAAG